MNRSTTLWKIFFLLCLPLFAMAQPQDLPDLQVSSITVTKVDGNKFSFKYQIRNVGVSSSGAVQLRNYSFQAYVSRDAVLDAGDLPAGGSIFGDNAPSLAFGQVYNGTWSSNPSGSIQDNYYLIFDVKLRPGLWHSDPNLSNNRLAKDLRPHFPDLQVSSIFVQSVDVKNKIRFTYVIKNVGSSDLHLDRFTYELYVSANSTYQPNADVYAGTGTFDQVFQNVLAPGQSDTLLAFATPAASVDLNNYPYLLFIAKARVPEPQKSLANDRGSYDFRRCFPELGTSITEIRTFTENELAFSYSVFNYGGGGLALDRFVGKLYASSNPTLEPGEDQLLGEKSLFDEPYVLPTGQAGQLYGLFIANITGIDLRDRPYIIFEPALKPGKTHHLRKPVTAGTKNLASYFPDLLVTDVRVQSVSTTNGINASFVVANYGGQYIDLYKYQYNVYLSRDYRVDPLDVFIKTGSFDLEQMVLNKSEATPAISVSFVTPANLWTYDHLVIELVLKPGETDNQFYLDNDFSGIYFEHFLGRRAAEEPTDFIVTQKEQGIHIEANSTQQQASEYILYSLSGEKVAEGSFQQQKQIPTVGLSSGLYILSILDKGTKESHKLIIQE